MISFDEVRHIAAELKQKSPHILGIELFGSIVHNGVGRDADLAILTDDTIARQWWHAERETIRVRWPDTLFSVRWIVKTFTPFLYSATIARRKRHRLNRAAEMLGVKDMPVINAHGKPYDVEFFLVPLDWRENTHVNQKAFDRITDLWTDKNTRGFLQRIAKDATRVA